MSPSISVPSSYRSTKRGLISDVARTYDILGWIAPTVLSMKVLYQQLWQSGHEWDEEVPSELKDLHARWRSELPLLSEKRLPRCYSPPHLSILRQELHGFADASLKAFGAVVYCRTVYHDHPPIISLVTAKTTVARLKPLTIPKLELCGTVLLVKILTNVAKVLDNAPEHWYAWTDSSIVLAWLDGNPRQYKVFVSNRVSYILEHTSPSIWRHVPTEQNPADCASRGMMPGELLNHQLWWEGPTWLTQEPILIPKQPPRKPLSVPELRPVNVLSVSSSVALQLCSISSNYHVTLAIAAWVLRFVNRIKLGKPSPDLRTKQLTGVDIRQAENWMLRESQTRSFSREQKALLKDKQLPPSSRLLALNPLLDKDNLLRVGGRLSNSALSQSQQHPIIADSKDTLLNKYFKYMHVVLCHCGPSLLLSATGTRLHVVGARRLSRTVCSQCITCRRASPKFEQLMGVLPAPRVTPAMAFTHTGMDFAGPFTIKMGYTRRPVKIDAHICVFICLTFKAIHLEVIYDQTTSAFLAGFNRFASRRNCPTVTMALTLLGPRTN